MNLVRNVLFTIAIIAVFLIFFISKNQNINFLKLTNVIENSSVRVDGVKTVVVSNDKISLKLEVADTPQAREKGLSQRKDIGEFDGMLFVFPEESYQTFWMKDMNFDLDIIWVDSGGEVMQIDKQVSANTYNAANPDSSLRYRSSHPIMYVMELESGMADKLGLRVNSKLSIVR
jgi:uncharacterized membrane protein (UPF0127 family)